MLAKLKTNYKENKNTLNPQSRQYIEGRIKVFKTILKNPKTPVYFDEKGDVQLGNILHYRCLYCQEDLNHLRNASFPDRSRNAERYCSKSCMIQHSKMKARIEKLGADRIIWGKSFVRIAFDHKCNNNNRKEPHWPLIFDLPTRKTRAKNFRG